jgi:uncharacterized protein (DUF2126 family)
VRYRARRLSASLHPTVPIHAPLVFNLIDTLTHRSVGQCTYYVAPPDGSFYETRPSNAAEAEQRRHQRFQVSVPAAGPIDVPEEEINPLFPMTLDLRLPLRNHNAQSASAGFVS